MLSHSAFVKGKISYMMRSEPLTSPAALRRELPMRSTQQDFIKRARLEIKNILEGRDPRLLLILGPCSIHDPIAVKEYAMRLKQLANEVSQHFVIAMRTHFEKPRTTIGWKGMLYDPHLDGSHDIMSGLRVSRQVLLDLLDLEVAPATEFLDPTTPYYYGDLIAWGSIGARTSSSQIHRQVASGLPMPVGLKNDTNGDLINGVHSLVAASIPHTFIGMGDHGNVSTIYTKGNSEVHLVLRGSDGRPNYDPASIAKALQLLADAKLPQRLLVDCSHDNAYKKHENQPKVFKSVLDQVLQGNKSIRGMILESHLNAGNQQLSSPAALKYATSITDPCIDWNTTEQLITRACNLLGSNEKAATPAITESYAPQYIHQ